MWIEAAAIKADTDSDPDPDENAIMDAEFAITSMRILEKTN
jgi:hypothetical protein